MLIAGGKVCMKVVANLISWIIRDRKFLKDWENSYAINLHKKKVEPLSTSLSLR